ncbi:hypothetical protein SAMN05216228_102940 [Rhizobium tibeticum]|uniref:Outer membrane protein D1 n=1 Tax=Rhizobium tibeticum TaxID=501024 RepID=A0A1H8TLC3_9HYPH|nr:Outer membrane protein D1 [Rhizobium tibeticum]SEO91278.1 hypothetical protein SAMN05216228_102940 [Rhizobium tibeticum]
MIRSNLPNFLLLASVAFASFEPGRGWANDLVPGGRQLDHLSGEEKSWLLGDWGGLRDRLLEEGIDFQLGYTGEFAFNPSGGTRSARAIAKSVAVSSIVL